MADTTIRVYLGIAVASSNPTIAGATVVTGDYKHTPVAELPVLYKRLVDITDFPDLIGETEDIDSTTMSDLQRTNEAGLQASSSGDFSAYFDRAEYEAIQSLIETNGNGARYRFCLLFTNSKSVFDWVGSINIGINGAGVGEMIPVTIQTSVSTQVRLRTGYDGTYYETASTSPSVPADCINVVAQT